MNDTYPKFQFAAIYTSLFACLSKLVEPAGFDRVMEAMHMKPPAFSLATQFVWDALLDHPLELLSDDVAHLLEEGQHAARFDYERYLLVAQTEWEKRVGEFLWCWEEAEEEFGGLARIGWMFRDMDDEMLEHMLLEINARAAVKPPQL